MLAQTEATGAIYPPVVKAFLTSNKSQLVVHCPFCRTFHYHGPLPGSRSSHCDRNGKTYVLKITGTLTDAVEQRIARFRDQRTHQQLRDAEIDARDEELANHKRLIREHRERTMPTRRHVPRQESDHRRLLKRASRAERDRRQLHRCVGAMTELLNQPDSA